MSSFDFTTYDAPDLLKRDVLCIRAIKHCEQGASVAKIIPSAFPGIVFHSKGGQPAIKEIVIKHVTVDNLPVFFLHGLGAEPSIMHFRSGSYTIFQVVLKPQALYTVLGLSCTALKRGLLSADEMMAEELLTSLQSETTESETIKLMFQFLSERLSNHGQRDVLVERSLDYIHQNTGIVTVSGICDALKVSERVLEKRFARVVGVSAQTYIRVKRVNEAIRLMNTGNYDRLVDIAVELNYYDQSHFIRDIKALSWLSPKSLIQQVTDFQLDQSGFSYY